MLFVEVCNGSPLRNAAKREDLWFELQESGIEQVEFAATHVSTFASNDEVRKGSGLIACEEWKAFDAGDILADAKRLEATPGCVGGSKVL